MPLKIIIAENMTFSHEVSFFEEKSLEREKTELQQVFNELAPSNRAVQKWFGL